MKYVDIDGLSSTVNSSSAYLQFNNNDGADPACTKVVYAGLYWTGRAHDEDAGKTSSPNIFNVPGITVPSYNVNSTHRVAHSENVPYTNCKMDVSMIGSGKNKYPCYTFTVLPGSRIDLEYRNGAGNPVFYRINYAAWKPVTGQINSGPANNIMSATFDGINIVAGSYTISIKGLQRDGRTNLSAAEYQSTSFATVTISGTSTQKCLHKHVVQLKHASAGSYTQIVAAANNFTENIYYPSGKGHIDGFMYSAYADVTEYVKQYGPGNYTIADIALLEGSGGGTGFYGGWGMVVIYENAKMKWRDISVFDGHAYVAGSITANYELPISGFHAVQHGEVNVKLGMMAGEGDTGVSGDYFEIWNRVSGQYERLNHGGNTTANFFNSSIHTGGNARSPNLKNNTGLDIATFHINNSTKKYITNHQTSTKFRYGSTQDTYAIFCVVLGIDAYVPEPEIQNAILTIKDKDGNILAPVNGVYTVEPGAKIDYAFYVRNKSKEDVNNLEITFPLPYTTKLLSTSTTYHSIPPGVYVFDQAAGPSGTIRWKVGNIPENTSQYPPNYTFASLFFTLEVIDDCDVLSSVGACVPGVVIDGSVSGIGGKTQIPVSGISFIYGFNTDCAGTPITDPPKIEISTDNHDCGKIGYQERTIISCASGSTIPYHVVAGNFQRGTRFYNSIDESTGKPPVNATEYTLAGGFPAISGITYYAVPSSISGTCYWTFKIQITAPPSFTLLPGKVCRGEKLDLMTLVDNITPSNSNIRFYSDAATTIKINAEVSPVMDTKYYIRSYIRGYMCHSTGSILVHVIHRPENSVIYRLSNH